MLGLSPNPASALGTNSDHWDSQNPDFPTTALGSGVREIGPLPVLRGRRSGCGGAEQQLASMEAAVRAKLQRTAQRLFRNGGGVVEEEVAQQKPEEEEVGVTRPALVSRRKRAAAARKQKKREKQRKTAAYTLLSKFERLRAERRMYVEDEEGRPPALSDRIGVVAHHDGEGAADGSARPRSEVSREDVRLSSAMYNVVFAREQRGEVLAVPAFPSFAKKELHVPRLVQVLRPWMLRKVWLGFTTYTGADVLRKGLSPYHTGQQRPMYARLQFRSPDNHAVLVLYVGLEHVLPRPRSSGGSEAWAPEEVVGASIMFTVYHVHVYPSRCSCSCRTNS